MPAGAEHLAQWRYAHRQRGHPPGRAISQRIGVLMGLTHWWHPDDRKW
jgi:hypothetical protein